MSSQSLGFAQPDLGDCCSHRVQIAGQLAGAMLEPFAPANPASFFVPASTHLLTRSAADLLVVGSIATGVAANPTAGAMAVRGGRVAALGSRDELEGLIGPDTEIVEAGDGVIVPGFVEPHMHLWASAMFDDYHDCSFLSNPTLDHVVERLRAVAAVTPPGQHVQGQLFDPSQYPGEVGLTVEILDSISTEHPISVLDASIHFLYLGLGIQQAQIIQTHLAGCCAGPTADSMASSLKPAQS